MTATQFLGAFNDNLFKQLMLLLSVTAVAATAATAEPRDLQGQAMFLFALPFFLFSGFAGFLSDRYSKRRVIVLSKLAEVAIMLLGMAAFFWYAHMGLGGALVVLCLMGTQSAFFGPGKYGILPEMLRPSDLPRANGIILMTTFLAIILGVAMAGLLKHQFGDRLWMASSVCVAIAIAGTLTSLLVRPQPPARPNLPFSPSSLTIPRDIRRLLASDRSLLAALLASCMFWLVGGIVQPAVNSLGLLQLKLDERWTSLLAAAIAVGIAIGCLAAGLLSRGRVDRRLVRIGAGGIVVCLVLLALPGHQRPHLLGLAGSLPVLVLLGMFAGMFAVPIQVYLQSRPPKGHKGRMIATMNIANWLAILISAVLYMGFVQLVQRLQWPPSAMFGLTALLMLPVALLYRPQSEELG